MYGTLRELVKMGPELRYCQQVVSCHPYPSRGGNKCWGDLKMVELLVNYDLLKKMCPHLVSNSNYDVVSHLFLCSMRSNPGNQKETEARSH